MWGRWLWTAWAASLAAALGGACGGSVRWASGTTGNGGSAGAPGCVPSEPPPPGPAQEPDGTGTVTFAVTKLYLGDTDPDGTPDLDGGWRRYGYDLDGVPSGPPSVFCQPRNAAYPWNVHPPGCVPVDNAFGHGILPILLGIGSDAAAQIDARFASGSTTLLISLAGLGPGQSYNPLPARLDRGGDLMGPPKLDGTDAWPVVTGTGVLLPSGYLVGDTWVSGPPTSMTIQLPLLPLSSGLPLHLKHAVLSMKLDPTHRKATGGVLAGVLPTEDFITQIKTFPGAWAVECCYLTCDGFLTQIEQASDTLQDGMQDPTQVCDGISIGLGFDAVQVQLGPVVPPPDPPPGATCAPDGG